MLSSGARPGGAALATATLATVALILGGCTTSPSDGGAGDAPTVITSTTVIAGAGVLGNQRRPDRSCPADPPAPDTAERRVANAPEVQPDAVTISGDPDRIVALTAGQLDALCALGLQTRVVGAGLPQLSYLGTVVHDAPPVGPGDAPDTAAIAAASPDLILGPAALAAGPHADLAALAPTVLTEDAGSSWRAELQTVAEATGRGDAVAGLLDEFTEAAETIAARADTAHYQASIVQVTEDAVRIYGSANFPAGVLRAAGLDRPLTQRFTDQPFVEVPTTDLATADLSAADADLIYVSFATPAAKDHAPRLFDSAAWRALSAHRDNRVFVVNNEVWQVGRGLIAARAILDDLQWVNAPIN